MTYEQGDYDTEDEEPRHFWNSRIFFYGMVALAVGFSLAFLPLFLNPAEYSTPSTAPPLIIFGVILSIAGMLLLFYSLFSAMWNSNVYSKRRNESYAIYRESILPALSCGVAYLLISLIKRWILPISYSLGVYTLQGNFQNAISTFLVASFVGLCVCFYAIKYPHQVTPNSPFLRTIIFSLFAFFIFAGFEFALTHPDNATSFFLSSLAVNSPRFLELGFVVGLVLSKSNGSQSER
jgi:hypothetical protein